MTASQEEVELALAAQRGDTGPVASPSVPYIKYIMEDDYKPDNIPPALRAVVYDKEMEITNLNEKDIDWLRNQLRRSVINFKSGRPISSMSYREEMTLSALPAKFLIKLARSRSGFERKQQTTQTVIKQAVVTGGQPIQKRRWSIFGRRKEGT